MDVGPGGTENSVNTEDSNNGGGGCHTHNVIMWVLKMQTPVCINSTIVASKLT